MTDEPGRIITSWEKLDELQKESQFVPTIALRTLIPTLDEYTGGCRGGQLIVISGDEGEGKSTFARSITNNFSQQEGKCLWFSYEERPDEFMAKFGEVVPYFLLPAVLEMSTMNWVAGRLKEAQAKYGTIHAMFIDHLHYLSDEIVSGNLSNDLGRICRKLKLIAVNENIIIILICHTNRSESAEELTVRSIRDSGMVGKEANKIWFVWRNVDDTSCVKVAKDRETGTKNKTLFLEKKGPFMYEYNKPLAHVGFHADRLKSKGRQSED